jgi:hypothetical protein
LNKTHFVVGEAVGVGVLADALRSSKEMLLRLAHRIGDGNFEELSCHGRSVSAVSLGSEVSYVWRDAKCDATNKSIESHEARALSRTTVLLLQRCRGISNAQDQIGE